MSRRIVILSIAVFLVTSIFAVNTANASWVGLSTDELIQKSDIILVGEIVSQVGEEKRSSQVPSATWVTNWKVKVFYYIKGNQEAEELIVTTPARSSLTYRLDQWGKTVLLFLHQREGMIEPISPQGVVGLERESFTHKQGEQITGQSILKEFTIVNPQINDCSVLEKYISDTGVVKIPKTEMKDTSMAKSSNTPKVIAVSLVILVLVVSGLWFAVKHLKKY